MHQTLNFDDSVFVFETVMHVRHTEIDASQYLTLESLTALLAEARERFLCSKSSDARDVDDQSLIIDSLQLSISSRVCAREALLFEVGVEPLSDGDGNIVTRISRMNDGSSVAKARQHVINCDFCVNEAPSLDNTAKDRLELPLLEL